MTMKTIKRYPNRKLYDTNDSCYVTLEDISMMIKDGVQVQVLDNKTKEDLTSITLAQIILEEEKKRKSGSYMEIFQKLIQSGGNALKGWAEVRFKGTGGAGEAASHYIDGMVKDGHIRKEESNRAVDMIKNFVEKYVKPTVENVQNIPNVQNQIQELQKKIEMMEKKLKTPEYKTKSAVKKFPRRETLK